MKITGMFPPLAILNTHFDKLTTPLFLLLVWFFLPLLVEGNPYLKPLAQEIAPFSPEKVTKTKLKPQLKSRSGFEDLKLVVYDYPAKQNPSPAGSALFNSLPALTNTHYFTPDSKDKLDKNFLFPQAHFTALIINFGNVVPLESNLILLEEFSMYGGRVLAIGSQIAPHFSHTDFFKIVLQGEFKKQVKGPFQFKNTGVEESLSPYHFAQSGGEVSQIFPKEPGKGLFFLNKEGREKIQTPVCASLGYG